MGCLQDNEKPDRQDGRRWKPIRASARAARCWFAVGCLVALGPVHVFAAVLSVEETHPGDNQVVLTISLSQEGDNTVSGSQFDLVFDSGRFSPQEIMAGTASVESGKEVMLSVLSDDRIRVMVAGLNQNTIADGEIASVAFSRHAGEDALLGAAVDEVVLSDAFGRPIDAEIVALGQDDTSGMEEEKLTEQEMPEEAGDTGPGGESGIVSEILEALAARGAAAGLADSSVEGPGDGTPVRRWLRTPESMAADILGTHLARESHGTWDSTASPPQAADLRTPGESTHGDASQEPQRYSHIPRPKPDPPKDSRHARSDSALTLADLSGDSWDTEGSDTAALHRRSLGIAVFAIAVLCGFAVLRIRMSLFP